MSLKEEFLKIETQAEYDLRKEKHRDLPKDEYEAYKKVGGWG